MSATPGKVCVDGVTEVAGVKVFVLHMIQAREPRLVGMPFFATLDPAACWLTDLEPVFADRFPFEPAGYEAVPDELPGLFPMEPDEPGELMVPAIAPAGPPAAGRPGRPALDGKELAAARTTTAIGISMAASRPWTARKPISQPGPGAKPM